MTVTPADPLPPDWAPSTRDVARHLARFTRVNGVIVSDFTEATVPTASAVLDLTVGRIDDVCNAAGPTLAARWDADPTGYGARAARWVVALGVASDVALSYYSSSGNSASGDLAGDLEARYVAALDRLLSGGGEEPASIDGGLGGAGGAGGAGGGSTTAATSLSPAGGFPAPVFDVWPW